MVANWNEWSACLFVLTEGKIIINYLIYMNLWLIVNCRSMWVRNIPIEGEGCKRIYERSYIWTAEKDMNLWFKWFMVLRLHLLQVYYKLTMWPAPRWLDSSVGRALHQYRRGHGFKSHSGLNFFQALISHKLCATINHKFIPFSTIQIYILSYIDLHLIYFNYITYW